MRITASKKITYIVAAFFVAILFIISSLWGGSAAKVHAATSTTEFEQINVMDDLQTATINGKPFAVGNYPYDSTGIIKHPEIMTVVEYCYSIRAAQRENYGVYIYFYNPQALNISTVSAANKIMLGVKYSEDKDGNAKVDDYEKFALQFCSKSTGDYHDLFYKFKVIDHVSSIDGKTIAERVNSHARRYDIIEIELLTVGDTNATAYGVGGTYIYSGYAEGYGADQNAESTLACEYHDDLETVTLDLAGVTDGVDKRTYWRSNSSSKGDHHQNQINSVFFAIDTDVLEKYGYTLQRIKAEWWEYKTAPAVVVDKLEMYNKLLPFSGFDARNGFASVGGAPASLYADDFYMGSVGGSTTHYNYTWAVSLTASGIGGTHTKYSAYDDKLLPLLFYTNGINIDDYVLSAERLQAYCEDYDKSYVNGHLQFNEHDFSADLFTDNVDEGRTRGYNLREFDITNPDDLWQINSYDSTHNWWDKFRDYGFGNIKTNDDYSDVSPIQMLKAEDFAVSNVADHLKINPEDVGKLKDYYNASVKDNNKDGQPDNAVFLFRYAQTDYFAQDLHVYDVENDESYPYDTMGKHNPTIAEVRQGTQIFDFDILTMTFNKKGNLTTLGCVSSPVDHWTGYTPSIEPTTPDWLKKLLEFVLAVVLLILLIVLLYYTGLLPLAWKVVKWIILAPFKLIGAIFKGIKKQTNKHKRE